MGNRILKLMVVMLSSINALVWWLYTESNFMAIVWAAIAVGFVYWLMDDMSREWTPRKHKAARQKATRVRSTTTLFGMSTPLA